MTGKVLFTKKNPKGIYGFIECENGTTHYFDTRGIIKGNYIKPGLEVEFDVIPSCGGKTQAVNVQLTGRTAESNLPDRGKQEQLLQLQSLRKMFDEGDIAGFLRSSEFTASQPHLLGIEGIELSLKALAGYLKEDVEQFCLNDFHRILISSPTVSDLKQYRDDAQMQELGAQTAFSAMTSGEYAGVFANVCNGKKTLNNNWNGIIERFWAARSNIAVYLTALWIIISQKYTGIDLYIDEAFKEKRINHLPLLLKVYADFVADSSEWVPLRLQKKIVGHCFDCNDIDALVRSYSYFDRHSLPELSGVISYVSGERGINGEILLSWFHSDLSELIAEKITNYYWWKECRNSVNPELIKVLSAVLWEYPTAYYSAIIYNQSCPSFGSQEKERILIENFALLCEQAVNYKKVFLLVSYLYNNLIRPTENRFCADLWNELKLRVKNQVMEQLSEDILSARAISIFKYDPETVRELEEYYCSVFASAQIEKSDTDAQLDEYINKCEEHHLSFISRWVIRQTGDAGVSDKELHFRSILASKQFADAVLFVQQDGSFSNSRKIELIKEILCRNFDEYTLTDQAYRIFDDSIPANIAEHILLDKFAFADSSAVMSLITLYVYRAEWLRVLYLFAPFKKLHRNTHQKYIGDLNSLLAAKDIRADRFDSHLDAVRAALKVFDSNEFDSFIKWAQGIIIPSSSRVYTPKPQIFDVNLQAMLKGGDYDEQWRQLTLSALRTDNNEKQDTLRYSIIASFIGRYGLAAFDSLITGLAAKRINSKGYADFYASLWKGLLSGNYSSNFLRISRPLIDNAPLTFWNLFYDVAVCKNHVFSASGFELSSLNGVNHQTQDFYEAVLRRYSYTRETVFAGIALQILSDSSEITSPMFEQYTPYCASKQNKTLLLSTIIRLISKNRFLDEISGFLDADCWRCDNSEAYFLRTARALCLNDSSFFLKDELAVPTEETECICGDYLECVVNYPDVRMTGAVYERIQGCSRAYRYCLAETLYRVQPRKTQDIYLSRTAEDIPEINNCPQDAASVRYYLDFMTAMHKKQLIYGSNDIFYIRNRYYRILAASILSTPDRMSFSDDELIALMQRNRHFGGVYPEYKEFKAYVLEFAASDNITEAQKQTFLLGLISNNWVQFVNSIASYDSASLELIGKIEQYTNFRNLNIHILREFIYTHDPNEESIIPCVEACSPLTASVMRDIRNIYLKDRCEYETCRALLVGICHLDDIDHAKAAYVNLTEYLQAKSSELRANFNMYMNALLATSYVKTIINILGDDVRNRSIDAGMLKLWHPVFASIDEVTVFYYLLSIRYAAENQIDEAKKAYAMIPTFETFPEEWNAEHADLQAWLSGRTNYFTPSKGKAVASFSVEKEATNISFIQSIVNRETAAGQSAEAGIEQAVKACRTIIRADAEDLLKYSSYIQLFSYVRQPEDLYDVYRQVEGRNQDSEKSRMTFNELVIEYGSLIISLEEQLSHDRKLDILIELFDVFAFLNDINKSKSSTISRLISAGQIVLETPGIHFEKWMECQGKIKDILGHTIIGCDKQDIEKWFAPINECREIYSSIDSQIELLDELEKWRSSRNLLSGASNFENAFIRSVDEKIQALRSGVNLAIVINSPVIEDNSVFYQIINTSPTGNASVLLSNTAPDGARLAVEAAVNGASPERFESAEFSNELILRPQDSCGQCFRLPSKITGQLRPGDEVNVILSIVCGGKVICTSRHQQTLFRVETAEGVLSADIIPNRVHYGTAVPAFSASIKGFGREREKADLRELLDSGLAIIYGPSRVGKSSLLNYIANEYFNDYCSGSQRRSIMQIRVADEQFSKNDYVVNMLSDGEPLCFENSAQIMEYVFCAPLMVAFSEKNSIKKMQMCTTGIAPFPEEARTKIMEILYQKGSITGKYSAVSEILSGCGCELWILFDEFQQIVEQWVGSANELAELCTFIKYSQRSSSIKLVFCGSDDLVRIFECVSDDNWNEFKIKTAETWVFVGQLGCDDFASMMNDRAVWKNLPEGTPWNMVPPKSNADHALPAVLQSLYDYTGGSAICGKIFGEELLEKVKAGKFAGRRFFYPADITRIAYDLLKADAGRLKNLLITHTTKNLHRELPYLLYIASELSEDVNKPDVSLESILDFFVSRESEEIETALKVLTARGIIKTAAEPQRYAFTTLFYYDFFKNLATGSAMQRLWESENHASSSAEPAQWLDHVVDIVKSQPTVDRADIAKIIDSREDDALKAGIGELYGKAQTIHAGTYIRENTGTNIGTQYNIQINAQTINAAFTTLLDSGSSDEMLVQAFRSMPSLSAYITDAQKSMISQSTAQLIADCNAYDACFSDDGDCIDAEQSRSVMERIAGLRHELEQISLPAEQKMLSDTIGAVAASGSFMDVSEQHWQKLLKISADKVTQLRALPAEILTPLSFAVVLHSVFDKIYSGIAGKQENSRDDKVASSLEKMDFCPVAIMYCKIVEAMLKKYHTPLYINGLGEKTLKLGGSTVFSDLGTREAFDESHQELSIGSYISHLVFLPRAKISLESPIQKPVNGDYEFGVMTFADSQEDFDGNIRRLIDDSDSEDEKTGLWKAHARALKIVHLIRNSSAHRAASISKEVFDWLIEILFEKGELMRIWELSK